jgi:predicted MFS family arabinose efflux permease
MGLFYTIYYVGMMLGTAVGGSYATWAGGAAHAFDFGAALLTACVIILWSFHRLAGARLEPARFRL